MTYHPVPYKGSDPWACTRPLSAWRTEDACLDTDPELFFPVGTTGLALDTIEEAEESRTLVAGEQVGGCGPAARSFPSYPQESCALGSVSTV